MDVTRVDRAVPGQYIIGFNPAATQAQRDAALTSFTPQTVEYLPSINGAFVSVDPSLAKQVAALTASAGGVVRYVQPNYLHYLRGEADAPVVNDPQFPQQYPLNNTGQTGGVKGADMKVTDAWKTANGAGVVVALADTNIDITHPDIAPNVWTNHGEIAGNKIDDDHNGYVDDVHGWNFGLNSNKPQDGGNDHGTHTAGIIAAAANNGIGVAGTAPGVKLMPLAILTSNATTANAIKAFDYAAKNGANIISNSWGNNTYEPALSDAVATATKAGLMVVVAAGNESWDTGVNGSYPDNYAGSVSIAASTDKDTRASYSNRGTTTIDVAAPGDNVLSSLPGGKYGKMSGTSMAAPGYAAVAAIVKSAYPNLTMKQVEQRIFRSVQTDGSAAGWNGLVASGGRVDAAAAVMPIATVTAPGVAEGQQVVAGAPVKLSWGSDITDGQSFKVQVSTNPDAVSTVHETFEGGTAARSFVTAGDAQWKITAGAGVDKSAAFAAPKLGRSDQARLSLTEVMPESGEVSFRYHGGAGELSFFIDRDLQMQPATSGEWKEFKATLPAGEHTLTWLSSGRVSGSGDAPAVDELKIAKVRDASWTNVGTTKPGETSIVWTPGQAAAAAAVRVQPSNGRWSGDQAEGKPFAVAGSSPAAK